MKTATVVIFLAAFFCSLPIPGLAYNYTKCGSVDCHWRQFPIGYLIGTSLDSLFDGAAAVAEESVSRWNNDRQTFCSIKLNMGGRTETQESVNDHDNVIFAKSSGWGYGPQTLAVTQCYYTVEGLFVDCDIAVNAQDWKWTDGTPDDSTLSLRDTLTHEAGHMWGLDHSDKLYATMYAYYTPKMIAADLDEDDIRGAHDRYCESEMPQDDNLEEDDSLLLTDNPFEEAAYTGLRLYDNDVFRLNVVDGKFPKIVIADKEPTRHKFVSVYDTARKILGQSPCDGDCVVAPTREPIESSAAYVMIAADFSRSRISTQPYDIDISQVEEVSPDELTDDEITGDDDDDGGMCVCSIGGGEEETAFSLSMMAAGLLMGLLMSRRSNKLRSKRDGANCKNRSRFRATSVGNVTFQRRGQAWKRSGKERGTPQGASFGEQREKRAVISMSCGPGSLRQPGLTAIRFSLATRHSPLATRHSPLATRHSPLATRHSPLATRHSPSRDFSGSGD